ncbi:MAG TPA: FxLYD domain-containing protein [Terriglobales bacterium]|nr:FxLYD domain-containing protein [Terriglobales bacterium]
MATNVNWKPYAIGTALTVVAALVIWGIERRGTPPSGAANAAYAAQVAITGAKVSAAESMMAGGVVYYDGTIENHGDKTLTACTVALTFHDIDGAVLETDQRSLLDAHLRPIPPHSQRTFEIGFDRVPAGWNQAPPDAHPVAIFVR